MVCLIAAATAALPVLLAACAAPATQQPPVPPPAALSDVADVIYLCSAYYDQARDSGFRFDDPEVGVEWPDLDFVVSDRDRNAPPLRSAPQQAAR